MAGHCGRGSGPNRPAPPGGYSVCLLASMIATLDADRSRFSTLYSQLRTGLSDLQHFLATGRADMAEGAMRAVYDKLCEITANFATLGGQIMLTVATARYRAEAVIESIRNPKQRSNDSEGKDAEAGGSRPAA